MASRRVSAHPRSHRQV